MMSRIDGQPARPALLCALASVLAAATAPDPRVTVPSGASRADAPRVEAAARDGLARAVPLVGYDRARCLDGSPGRYYVDVYGDNTKIYVHLQGGGFCGSSGLREPSRTPLGSTRPDVPGAWGPTGPRRGAALLSRNATRNPLLADFTHVFVVYCDGAYFAGTSRTRPEPGGDSLFFRGGPSSTPSSRTSTSPARRT
ncbi:pectin acetylesterase [Aureococcus anophagefferens]|nr:pectin acetylesterase [Aureococcus anophagefferens]